MKRKPSHYRQIVCHVCQKSFDGNHSQAKYCSDDCSRIGMRKSWNKYSKNNKTYRNSYQKEYYKNNKKLIIERTRKYQKTLRGKVATRQAYLNQKEKNPEKIAARQAVLIAVRNGTLKKMPCQYRKCIVKKTEAHHDDYSKPLCVKWYCHTHHRLIEGRLVKV